MKKIILHCGMPKTGSSALQVQFAKSRGGLLKHGYDYLEMGDFNLAAQGKISSGNAAGLARAYLFEGHPASLNPRRAKLTEKFMGVSRESTGDVILSSEFFSVIPVPNMVELVQALSEIGPVQLVFFVREQLNFLASAYIQQVKRHGLTQYPEDYFSNWEGYKIPLMYFSYLDRLSKALPEAQVTALPYELSKGNPAGLMGLFLEMIGAEVPKEDLVSDLQVNLSPSPQEIRLMLEINKHHPRMQFSDMLVEASHNAGRSKIHAQHSILPPAFMREVEAFFKVENAQFFEHIAKGENIYLKPEQANDFVDLKQISFEATDVFDVMGGMMVSLDNRIAALEEAKA